MNDSAPPLGCDTYRQPSISIRQLPVFFCAQPCMTCLTASSFSCIFYKNKILFLNRLHLQQNQDFSTTQRSLGCTLTARLSYICISNRSKIHSYAKTGQTGGNFAKYGVQSQEADYHTVRRMQAFVCKKKSDVLAQKDGLCTAIKAYLQCKQALIAARKHLNCHANKPSLHCK